MQTGMQSREDKTFGSLDDSCNIVRRSNDDLKQKLLFTLLLFHK